MDAFLDVRLSSKCVLFCWSLIVSCPLQEVQKHMLGKEWLAKVDNETSTPYLLVGSVPFIVRNPVEL